MKHQAHTGKIKWFDAKKGFGFIARPDAKDLFVHIRQVYGAGPHDLHEGDLVSFYIGNGPKGEVAEQVRIQIAAK